MLTALPPICRALLVANGIVYLLQMLAPALFLHFALWPLGEFSDGRISVGFLPWQLISYGFLHGGFMHLFFNMFALLMFGAEIERLWGSRRFATYYFTCLAGAGLVQLVVATLAVQSGSPPYPTVGASGGMFGLLLAFGMMFPNRQVLLLIPPIPMKASTLVIAYGALELLMGVLRTQSGVAHFAHLGGMAFGFFLIQYWRRRWPFGARR